MKRGEIWTAAGGPGYGSKPRPVIIIQNDRFDATNSITVCGLTTTGVDAGLGRVQVQPTEQSGLMQLSWVMVDKVVTMRRAQLDRRLGAIGARQVTELNRALVIFLGLSSS